MWHAWEMRGKYTWFWWESRKKREDLKDQVVDRKMEPELILGRLAGGCVEWIQLAQDRGLWWALVNKVMNMRVLAPRI
jgi:hypothetical protein